MQMWEYGFIDHWYSRYRGRYEQCIVRPLSPRMSPLKLEHLYSVFILLLLGITVSFVAFVLEHIKWTNVKSAGR